METFTTHNLDETVEAGRTFASRLGAGDCVGLDGQLGAGKTQFARGIALGLGLADGRLVTSPTFVLMNEYPARVPVYHLDAYRLGDPGVELIEMGLEEMLETGVVLLEWAERAPSVLPSGAWRVAIEITGATRRRICVERRP